MGLGSGGPTCPFLSGISYSSITRAEVVQGSGDPQLALQAISLVGGELLLYGVPLSEAYPSASLRKARVVWGRNETELREKYAFPRLLKERWLELVVRGGAFLVGL